jgi:putative tricarboxylic transport membrane protein
LDNVIFWSARFLYEKIGLILGELVEGTLRQSLVIFEGNWLMFFTRPIALTFFILSLIALAFPLIRSRKIKRNND